METCYGVLTTNVIAIVSHSKFISLPQLPILPSQPGNSGGISRYFKIQESICDTVITSSQGKHKSSLVLGHDFCNTF